MGIINPEPLGDEATLRFSRFPAERRFAIRDGEFAAAADN
jgi:hypothetical protein